MGKASLKKKSKFFLISILPQHQSPESASIKIPPFRPKFTIVKIPLNVNIVKWDLLHNKPERGFGLQVRDGDFIEFEFKTRCYSYSLFTHFTFKGRDSTKLEIMSLMSFHWFSILFKMILKSWLTFTGNYRNLKFIEWISAFYFYAPWMTSLNLI